MPKRSACGRLAASGGIRYSEWVEKNRAYVAEQTDGKVGYVHIPDMGEGGLIEFARIWYPHYYKHGFIVDERYNGGGFTGDMIIDRLERRILGHDPAARGQAAPRSRTRVLRALGGFD